MSSSPDTVASSSNVPSTGAADATAAGSNAAAAAAADDGGDGFSSVTEVQSIGQLQQQAPQVYNAMLQGIAMNICNDMQKQQEEIKKIQQDYERN